MQLKTFAAPTSSEVMAQIKQELGADAIILDSREEDGMVVMTAALERPGASTAPHPAAKARNGGLSCEPPFATGATAAPGAAGPAVGQDWLAEWNDIKRHLFSLMKPEMKLESLAPRQRLALDYLRREGVRDETLLALYQTLKDKPDLSVLEPLARMAPVRPFGREAWPQRIHCLTGPFGAGKTSAAIRLALLLRKEAPGERICLVNADASRGNGRLLLRHYAELTDMACKEAQTPVETAAAILSAEKEGFDRIMVDLPGLGRERTLVDQLADCGLLERLGDAANDAAAHLVFSPHYSDAQLEAALRRYSAPKAASLIWGKLDEAENYGLIVNAGFAGHMPVSAFSYGPGLGNTLKAATENCLWRLIFKRELPA